MTRQKTPSTPSKKKAPVAGSPEWPLPEIPKEVIDQFVDGPMTAEAVQVRLCRALIIWNYPRRLRYPGSLSRSHPCFLRLLGVHFLHMRSPFGRPLPWSVLLRVEHSWDEIQLAWHPVVNGWGETSLAGFRIAGDGVSIYGAAAAELSGTIAAIGAALSLARLNANEAAEMVAPIRARLHRANRIRPFLDTLYRPPAWLLDCPDETIICRCEEVTAGRVGEMARLGCQGPNQTKFFSRCGMGPCQGRMCGISVTQILAKELGRSPEDVGAYRIRAPIKPINLGSFATLNSSQDSE